MTEEERTERSSSLRVAQEVPPGSRAFSVSTGGLPTDILEQASRRLAAASLIYATVYTLAYLGPVVVASLFTPAPASEFFDPLIMAFAIAAIVLSLAFFFVFRFSRMKPQRLLDLGLIYEIVGAFGIAMAVHWALDPPDFGGVPWEAVWILIFPMFAPNTPGKTLLASLAAASMGPLSVALSAALGPASLGPTVDSSALAFATYFLFTNYVCAGIAFAASHIIYGLGRRLKEAQDIGSYQLIELLGRGGMGEVWLANHRMLARPAAIKLIRRDLLAPSNLDHKTSIRRFEKEARATAALRSKHTIDLYDFGVAEDGSFYYVMEFLDGLSLDSLIKRFGPIAPERVVHLLRQVCHSLGEAHGNGLVHRDVKPANIYACRLGPDLDFVKVLDFGIVKSTGDLREAGTQLTKDGAAPGTPAFIAPEMALGDESVDGRADIYALGCVAYWLLTGQLVFEAATPFATAMHHIQSEPVPPSRRTEIEIPNTLERIVLTCLAKDRAERPQSAAELDAALALSVPDRIWTPERAAEWWRLHMPELVSVAPPDPDRQIRSRKVFPVKG